MDSKTTMSGVQHVPESEMEAIEMTIQAAREKVQLKDELVKLGNNKAFKKIFMEGYLKTEAVRLTELAGQDSMKEFRGEIFDAIKGISHFHQFMDAILREGDMAAEAIMQHEMMLDDIRAEEEEDQ